MVIKTLLTLLLVFLLAATAAARPCKTLFYFSATTTTTTYYPHHSLNRNPNPNFLLRGQNPHHLTLIFTTTTTTTTRFPNHRPSLNFVSDSALDENSRDSSSSMMTSSVFPMKFFSSISSIDRARDIMSLVGALLIGVGFGALTAAVMYIVWALFFIRRLDFDYVSSDDDDEGYDDVAGAKKLGYVAIPTKPKMVEDDIKKPALPAKEVV